MKKHYALVESQFVYQRKKKVTVRLILSVIIQVSNIFECPEGPGSGQGNSWTFGYHIEITAAPDPT